MTVTIDEPAYGLTVVELVRRMAARDPIVMVGDHDAESGIIRLDPENLDLAGADEVIAAFMNRGA